MFTNFGNKKWQSKENIIENLKDLLLFSGAPLNNSSFMMVDGESRDVEKELGALSNNNMKLEDSWW